MSAKQDMTPVEAGAAFDAFRGEVGSKAELHVSLMGLGGKALCCSLYPRGILDRWCIRVGGDTFAETLAAIREAWDEAKDTNAAKTLREMALAIIEITADLGECTDAALRAKFDHGDVARYGERACAEANDIAGRGPFEIVSLGGANSEAA